jgi:hypothetical protein
VTGGRFVRGRDPLPEQKRLAVKALRARDWFAPQRPANASELPLTYEDRERIKIGGVDYIVSVFARSLAMRDYEIEGHPRFDQYARGVMASENAPDLLTNDAELRKQYPPAPLPGLGPGLVWRSHK